MALTRIEGHVDTKLGSSGYAIKETIKTDAGQMWEVRWAVWTKQELALGDFVRVDGDLGVKMREYTNAAGMPAHTVDRNLNNCTIKVLKKAVVVDDLFDAAPSPSEPF
jgi:hypothetical protein